MREINDYDEAAREYYGTTTEDYYMDLHQERELNGRLLSALEELLSALEDVGMGEGSKAYDIATKALREAA